MKIIILFLLMMTGAQANPMIAPTDRSSLVELGVRRVPGIGENGQLFTWLGESKAVKNVGVAEFEKLRAEKTNIVLDVRSKKEFAAGHIPGAINIDVNGPEFQKQVQALDRNKVYLVHCAAGRRSATACEKMDKLDFPRLYNLEGGLTAWEKAGHKSDK